MAYFSKREAQQILANEIHVESLLQRYPEYKDEVLKELALLKSNQEGKLVDAIIAKYTSNAKLASTKIHKSGMNEKTIETFLPVIIKSRFAIYLLEQVAIAAAAENTAKPLKLNLWDGAILQRLLFQQDLQRKPVSLRAFKLWWRLVRHKNRLMPLVNQKGIYCFYSKPLIQELSSLIGGRKCLEIAAGDGTLSKFLNESRVDGNCIATDDYSWQHYISYPDFVEKADAKTALRKYSPEVVICSWPVAKNTYEKHVFKTSSVQLYIVIGTKNPAVTGDFEAYQNADNEEFTMEYNERLSSLILPPSEDHAVYIFRRKGEF